MPKRKRLPRFLIQYRNRTIELQNDFLFCVICFLICISSWANLKQRTSSPSFEVREKEVMKKNFKLMLEVYYIFFYSCPSSRRQGEDNRNQDILTQAWQKTDEESITLIMKITSMKLQPTKLEEELVNGLIPELRRNGL